MEPSPPLAKLKHRLVHLPPCILSRLPSGWHRSPWECRSPRLPAENRAYYRCTNGPISGSVHEPSHSRSRRLTPPSTRGDRTHSSPLALPRSIDLLYDGRQPPIHTCEYREQSVPCVEFNHAGHRVTLRELRGQSGQPGTRTQNSLLKREVRYAISPVVRGGCGWN